MNFGNVRRPSHPWQLLVEGTPQLEADALTARLKKYRVAKSDIGQCKFCMTSAPHPVRIRLLRCACEACVGVSLGVNYPWRARIRTCQQSSLVTIEVAYNHLTPAHAPQRPILAPTMKAVVHDWAGHRLKPKRIWTALIERFKLTETTAPLLSTVQRVAHHHVTRTLGGSDILDAVRSKIAVAAFKGDEEEATAFTFTSQTDKDDNATTENGSDGDPFVVGVSSKKLLRRADRDPRSFVFHVDATYKLTQVGYPVVVAGISDRARRFHLLGIFIFSQQQQIHHAEVLELLRRMCRSVTLKTLRVRYVMGDADAAQWNAFQEVFGRDNHIVFLMCYFHVAKKIYEKTRSLTRDTAISVMTDIHQLHFSPSEQSFREKLEVMLHK